MRHPTGRHSTEATHDRVLRIQSDFAAADLTAPWLMCDRHPEEGVAFRFVSEDLSVEELSYGELRARSERAAAALRAHGVQAGDRVAGLLGKGPDLPALILGIWRLGAVYVPLFTAFAATTVGDRIESSDARVLVTDRQQLPKAKGLRCVVMLANEDPAAGKEPTDLFDLSARMREGERLSEPAPVTGAEVPIVHMFTSGTTGKPKPVVHPLGYAAGWQSYLELGLAPGGSYWCGADPGWAYGLYTAVVAPLISGVPSLLTRGTFQPETTWQILEKFAVTDFAAAPTVYRALRACDQQVALPALQRLSSAGEPLTPEVSEWTKCRFGVPVHDHFGQTEVGMTAGFPHHGDLRIPPAAGAMGTGFPGWSVTVLKHDSDVVADPDEVGRLAVSVDESPFFTFTGYGVDRSNRASRFTSAGDYYLTGDLASVDSDGLIRFSSRDDDVILMAGYRIGPFDVESVLLTHPQVAECAVVAAPDEVRGEVIHAFVVTTAQGLGGDDALAAELQNWVRTNYAAHAYPRRVTFVEMLPKTPSGKIQRAVLRQQLRDAAQDSTHE